MLTFTLVSTAKACNFSSGISARISFTFIKQKSKKAIIRFLFIHHIISHLYCISNTYGKMRACAKAEFLFKKKDVACNVSTGTWKRLYVFSTIKFETQSIASLWILLLIKMRRKALRLYPFLLINVVYYF